MVYGSISEVYRVFFLVGGYHLWELEEVSNMGCQYQTQRYFSISHTLPCQYTLSLQFDCPFLSMK